VRKKVDICASDEKGFGWTLFRKNISMEYCQVYAHQKIDVTYKIVAVDHNYDKLFASMANFESVIVADTNGSVQEYAVTRLSPHDEECISLQGNKVVLLVGDPSIVMGYLTINVYNSMIEVTDINDEFV